MYDTIVVPTDGSEHAIRAAEHGYALARLFDATVHVLNVVTMPDTVGTVNDELLGHLEQQGAEAVEAVEAVAGAGVPVETAVVRGQPARGIVDYVDDHDADLVAMGTHGRTGLERYVEGSVTERVVRMADVPVLTTRETEASDVDDDYDEILLPTDGSDPAAAAVDHAFAVAERADARVHAVNIVDIGSIAVSPGFVHPTEVLDRLESEGERATQAVADRGRSDGVEVVTEVREGYASNDLLDYADDNGIDLITMGTHGRTGFERYILGSTTTRIVRQAEAPVLAIKANEQ
ncbi:universal stress protein [Candidatus Halobonum tyrrellensis]|uniref:Universal stress protein UspA-like protein n=1 Tax=Candidatus Halobonum tyrrellensis G22 TaxID=1324957 RepID=V4H8J2_9EURY|nr:universal stress protein UspA-like protein [Candidatus Halobonum tyrrellensis G22]